MKKYFLQFLTAVAVLVLVACSKSDEGDSKTYAIIADIDGVELKAEQKDSLQQHIYGIAPGKRVGLFAYSSDDRGFYISIEEGIGSGTYELGNSGVNMTYIKEYNTPPYYYFESGTVTILELDQSDGFHFKATFSGEAVAYVWEGDDSIVQVTNGKFELNF